MAVVLHGYPRLTRDIDLLVRPAALEVAKEALARVGFTIEAGIIPFDVGKPHERRVFESEKAKSRGISADMSPRAISARLDILVELHETARALASAKRVGKPQASPRRGLPGPRGTGRPESSHGGGGRK